MDDRTWKERLRDELKKIKELPFKKKLEYIWDYYKLLMAGIALLILGIVVVVQLVEKSKIVTELSVACINNVDILGEMAVMQEDFAEYGGFTGEYQEVNFDGSYQMTLGQYDSMTTNSQSKLVAVIAAQNLDVLMMPKDIYEFYLGSSFYMDLKEVLTPEEYEQYEDLLYFDKQGEDTQEKAYGIQIKDNEQVEKIFGNQEVVLSVVVNSKKQDNAKKFVQYLLSQS